MVYDRKRTFVLPVEGAISTTPAKRMRLCVSLTVERWDIIRKLGRGDDQSLTYPKDEVPRQIGQIRHSIPMFVEVTHL